MTPVNETSRSAAADLLRQDILRHLALDLGRDPDAATVRDWRVALTLALRDRITTQWLTSERTRRAASAKRVYYLSMEFLIGRLLEDAIVNLRLEEATDGALASLGLDADAMLANEPDAALGNGGLGRLAACFLESLSSLGLPAMGYGIRYEHGLFRQSFDHGRQVEAAETWLKHGNPWEIARPETAFEIGFFGHVHEEGSRAIWSPGDAVRAEAHDIPVIGWQGGWANALRLWAAKPVAPFNLDAFNHGAYAAAAEGEAMARTISRVLYPDDNTEIGKELRLKQEYFFTAASLRDILKRHKAEGHSVTDLPRHVAIQLNDTHPAIAGPELVRLLHDEEGLDFELSVEIARACLSYTNHTLLPEALERWSEGLMAHLLPRHVTLIERIDAFHAAERPNSPVRIREHGQVKMGELSFIMAHKVNGVSALHTDLMKSTVFAALHADHPDRIINQTNGVTPRRWLHAANPGLSHLICDRIGRDWLSDLERLSDLEPKLDDAGLLTDLAGVKRANKAALTDWLKSEHEMDADPDAMFDVQIKRIHEYKRQHLNILEAIALWQEIHDNPNGDWTPRVKIFGGKAAPGYHFAKDMIRLINDVARVVNADPVTNRFLKVHFLPNYNVTMAERLIPAADLSEQISTAGKEASGTGNMKFALNGALTIGTLDGANVEIRERVGEDNFLLFGMTAAEVDARRAVHDHAAQAIAASPRLARALQAVRDGRFSEDEPHRYHGIADNISGPDYFLVASDFEDYWRAQREADALFATPESWTRKAALNIARSGWFSSDRTIRSYNADVWNLTSLSEG
ncbi:MAG: glycogen/starch/alpha-glucan phosphorylase [Silicimonas sp.]|nr:glycogen/starch/alpha-glucan phosphorylase [Silicimonas sp.]